MKMLNQKIFRVVFGLILLSSLSHANQAQRIPLNTLFGEETFSSPIISPLGNAYVYTYREGNVNQVRWVDLKTHEEKVLFVVGEEGMQFYGWVYDGMHVLLFKNKEGSEYPILYRMHVASGLLTQLSPDQGSRFSILKYSVTRPEVMLVSIKQIDSIHEDIHELFLEEKRLVLREENRLDFMRWYVSDDLKSLAALKPGEVEGYSFWTKESRSSDWVERFAWNSVDSAMSNPLGFSGDGKNFYLKDTKNSDKARLVEFHMTTGDERVLAEGHYDLHTIERHATTGDIQWVSYLKQRLSHEVVDLAIQEHLEVLGELKDGEFRRLGSDLKNEHWLIAYFQDKGPIEYYHYALKEKKATFLYESGADLRKYELAEMQPIQIKARDGLQLEGYITFPARRARKNLPMILKVHGGPWNRDRWGYDSTVQWMANRGYAVLQVNYRGSTGYGKSFVNASRKEWGGKMQEDLLDAVGWAIHQGYADPERIAIYGRSYGGYAALLAATLNPQVFQCAISIAGPSNLVSFLNTIPKERKVYAHEMHQYIGHPEKDKAFLESKSPLFKTDQINIPILIAQGGRDKRVKAAEAEQMVEALKSKGLEYKYLFFEDEGHQISKSQNNIQFYKACEDFLERHLNVIE